MDVDGERLSIALHTLVGYNRKLTLLSLALLHARMPCLDLGLSDGLLKNTATRLRSLGWHRRTRRAMLELCKIDDKALINMPSIRLG